MELLFFLLFERWLPKLFGIIHSGFNNLLRPVGSVAEWSFVGLFAVAEPHLLCLWSNVSHWTILDDFLQVQILARLIAKWLRSTCIPTAAPGVLHVLYNLKFERFMVCDCALLRVHVHT